MADIEQGVKEAEVETAFNDNAGETEKFLEENGEPKSRMEKDCKADVDFVGLSREELEKYATDPTWVKVRWILLALMIVGWVAMLAAAIIIVVLADNCPKQQNLKWYESGVMYKVNVPKFRDSNSDNVGDIEGMVEKFEHYTDLGVDTLWLDAIVTDQYEWESSIGELDDLLALSKQARKNSMRVVVPIGTPESPIAESADAGKIVALVKNLAEKGAEGFIMYFNPAASDTAGYFTLIKSVQDMLDADFNKRDDRDRLVITSGLNLPIESEVNAELVTFNCTEPCDIVATANATMDLRIDESTRWSVVQYAGSSMDGPSLNLVRKLTIPGTVVVNAGEEIGNSGGYFIWNDFPEQNWGFTESKDFQLESEEIGTLSLMKVQSLGYTGINTVQLAKDLIKARDEPSLLWGDLKAIFEDPDVDVYTRASEDQSTILIATSRTGEKALRLTHGDFTHGKVLAVFGISGVATDDVIDLSAINFEKTAAIVVELLTSEAAMLDE